MDDDAVEDIELSVGNLTAINNVSFSCNYFKGSPGAAGLGVAGSKGEPGDRVSSSCLETQDHKTYSLLMKHVLVSPVCVTCAARNVKTEHT